MENTPLVTVIVAAYNVDRWLYDCLDSILNQSYRNWECLIVNDGSKDRTKDVALAFCERDARFKLIDKINEGVPTVRNMGLDNAQGNFIQFIDGDDMLTEDCLEYSISNIGESHILASDCIAISNGGTFIRQTNQGEEIEIDRTQSLRWTLNRKLLSSVWSKFYRRNIIGDLRFNKVLLGGEDIYFNTELLLKHPDIKVKVSNHPIYRYRIINSSISHIRNNARLKRAKVLVEEMDRLYEMNKETIDQECLDEYARNMIRELMFHYSLQGTIKRTEPSLLPLLRKWHTLLVDKTSKEFAQTKFVETEFSAQTDLRLTLRYLPETIRGYAKRLLSVVRK